MHLKISQIIFLAFLISCSSNDENPYSSDFKSDIKLYSEGMNFLKKKEYDKATETFNELEIQHPYSAFAAKGQLMSGFAHYKANEYEEAILTLSKFIELNPNHESIAYAMYLKAYSYYERMPDVNLDQNLSKRAFEEFSELINRFPKTKYAKKSLKHLNSLKNHLAAREVKVGKFYQSQGFFLAGIKRYKTVLSEYKKSTHVPESIFRLIECYISMGLTKQSLYLYKILEYNFPKSQWQSEARGLIIKNKLNKKLKKFRKKQLDLDKLNPADFDLI